MVSEMSASASAQFLLTSKTSQAMYSILRWRSRSPTRNSRPARSSMVVRLHDWKAVRAAFIAGSTCSLPAFWWIPTICEGFAGFSDLILSAVLTRLPPMTRSYSRPSWLRTLATAARIRRAFSSLRKSKNGSVTNGPACRLVRGRTGASNVAMGDPLGLRTWEIMALLDYFTPREAVAYRGKLLLTVLLRRTSNMSWEFCEHGASIGTPN